MELNMNKTKIDYANRDYHLTSLTDTAILIAGGAGFIGSHLLDYLLTNGAKKVRVLDNLSTGSLENIKHNLEHPAFEFLEGDITNMEHCTNAMDGMDVVLHQAALGSVPRSVADPMSTDKVNVLGFVNCCYAAKEAGIKRFVYASSSSVYGDSPELPKKETHQGNLLSPYAVSKMSNELYAGVFGINYGMEMIGLRYFNVFGPRQSPEGPYAAVIPLFLRAASNKQTPSIFGDGLQSRDFTYIENVVKANIRAATTSNGHAFSKAYNIAYGQRIDLLELWHTIAAAFEISIKPEHKPERKGDIKHSLADISLANELLDYNPEVSVQQGLRKTVAWFKDNF